MGSRVSVALVLVLLAVAGCSTSRALPPGPNVAFDDSALEQGLRAAGADVTSTEATWAGAFGPWPRPTFLTVAGRRVQVYAFANTAAANSVATSISPDGYGGPFNGGQYAEVEWKGVPHLFRRDRLIVIYLAESVPPTVEDSRVLTALKKVMGQQFAGAH